MDNQNPYAATDAITAPPSFPRKPETDVLSPLVIGELAQTQPWVRFLGTFGLISCILMLLFGAFSLAVAGKGVDTAGKIGMSFAYIFFAFLFMYPALKLQRYSVKIKDLVRTRSMGDLEMALRQQRLFWRFYGILTTVYLVIVLGAVFLFLLQFLTGS